MHDGIGQDLAAVKMSCDLALQGTQTEEGRRVLEDALNVLNRCTSEVRTMSHLLHPPLLEEIGLASAIPWYVEGFSERSGIKTSLDLPANLTRLPEAVELTVFRILQESLTNIHRHSGSKTANIKLQVNRQIVALNVEDHGKGLEPRFKRGVGIASMRERARELGGELAVEPGHTGVTVRLVLPLNREVACLNA